MLINNKDELLKKKEELKKELANINKKLRSIKVYEFVNKDENMIFCDCCNKYIKKYAYSKHIKTENHILKSKLQEKNIDAEKK